MEPVGEVLFTAGWPLQGSERLLWLFLCLLLWIASCRGYSYLGQQERERLSRSVAAAAAVLQLLRALLLMLTGRYGAATLPLHLCSMGVYLCLYHACTGSERAGQFLYALCLPGAVLALLFPAWVGESDLLLSAMSFLGHGLLADYILLLVVGGTLRPRLRAGLESLALLLLLSMPIQWLNRRWGTNYCFLSAPAPASPMVWLRMEGRWGHLAGVPILLTLCWIPMYLPFRKEDKKAAD